MTVLAVIRNSCAVIPLDPPESVFSGQEREHFELQALANNAAGHIARDCEWQKLKQIAAITGDGAAETFALPSDYDRMLKETEIRTSRHRMALAHIVSSDRWLDMTLRELKPVPGIWTIYGNHIHIRPVLEDGEVIRYFYISANWALDLNGTPKAAFTADTDIFCPSEKLLELCMIWKWRAAKGLSFAEDLAAYEDEKEKLIIADKGARILSLGRARPAGDSGLVRPGMIVL